MSVSGILNAAAMKAHVLVSVRSCVYIYNTLF